MARARSTPASLEEKIVTKWVDGSSPEELAVWVKTTNNRRMTPVETSRSSIERLLARRSDIDGSSQTRATARRLQHQVPTLLDRLETLDAEYARLIDEAEAARDSTEETPPRMGVAFNRKLQALARRELITLRRLRLAGAGRAPAQSDSAVEQREMAHEEVARTEAIDARIEELLTECPLAGEASLTRKSVRLKSGKAHDPEVIESNTAAGPPAYELPREACEHGVPFLQELSAKLTAEQLAEWDRTTRVTNRLLLAAWKRGARDVEPDTLPPSEDNHTDADDPVPALQLPEWLPKGAPTLALLDRLKSVNGWLRWLRTKMWCDVDSDFALLSQENVLRAHALVDEPESDDPYKRVMREAARALTGR